MTSRPPQGGRNQGRRSQTGQAPPRPRAASPSPAHRAANTRPAHRAVSSPAHRAPRRGLSATNRVRAFGLLVIMAVAFVAIVARLTYIQGIGSDRFVAVGSSEWTHTVTLPAERGSILDRNGNELAISIPQTTLYADPHQVTSPLGEAAALAPVLGADAHTLQSKLSSAGSFVYVARTVSDPVAAKVKALRLPGVFSLQEPKRFYPAGQLASPLIGVVGTEGTGLSGLEAKYQRILDGRAGKLVDQTDPSGHQIAGGLQQYQAPIAGRDLVLTLDDSLQYDAEQALAQAVVAAKARSGIALLMNRRTGALLADAELSMPTAGSTAPPAVPVNIVPPAGSPQPPPNTGNQPVESTSATSFTQVYEPGSVNKLVTLSGGLEQGVITPSSQFTIPNTYDVAGTQIHDAETHGTERWDVTDILTNSSNIGTLQIAQRLGRTNLLKYISGYGEGKRTAVGFPGESSGLLPSYWSGTTLADVSFGQGIGVTAMQVLGAYNAIANGGVYVAPKLVAGTIEATGAERPTPTPPPHRVVSTTVAKQMSTMLDEVVRVGTGQAADLSPYTVAGKTGTASVPSAHGGYVAGDYVASFAGFVPSEDPAITAMVVINGTPDYGAAASAPTFATLARDALQEMEVPPHAKDPPASGVPLTNSQTATAAGEVAGTALPGLTGAPPPAVPGPTTTVAPATGTRRGGAPTPSSTTSTLPPVTTAPTTPRTTAVGAGPPGGSFGQRT